MIIRRPSLTVLFSFLSLLFFNCHIAFATMYYIHPGDDVVGQPVTVKAHGDTLLTIANRYNIGMHEILETNPQLKLTQETATNKLRSGKNVIVPTAYVLPPFRKGIVINLAELRLYYFPADGSRVYTYPVGVGRTQWRTPLASTSVISKEEYPTWHVPPTIKQYVMEQTGKELPDTIGPEDPENPLGRYAMHLGVSGYLIHGTNQPWSIGKFVSSGCIRMHNEDVEELYSLVTPGTPVHIINYANKVGWHQGQLYMESQIPLQLSEPEGILNENSPSALIESKVKSYPGAVDWNKVNQVSNEHLGIPQAIGGGKNLARQASIDGANTIQPSTQINHQLLSLNVPQSTHEAENPDYNVSNSEIASNELISLPTDADMQISADEIQP